jgi:[ribosomal protein S5]-alanine N-acetyltransferase
MIVTTRLILRDITAGDKIAVADLLSNADVMKFIGPRRIMNTKEIELWMTYQIKETEKAQHRFAVTIGSTNEFIGMAGFQMMGNILDFGFYFRKQFWGFGYATEACSAIISHMPESAANAEVFIADNNLASIKVISKLGYFAKTKITRQDEAGHLYARMA